MRGAVDPNKDGDSVLPGFRFHPTDEELVGFYLRRKVEKKPISIEIIKHVDIYKYDPWDLPRVSINVGDKEWYFFCKRGRKYKNSVRPNRVTASGFWKATGIDKPIHSDHHRRAVIGLKKSLVYYLGSAGKGTKTDWMMHEFRLPAPADNAKKTNSGHAEAALEEAEVWTLCRVFKRATSYKKYAPVWRIEELPDPHTLITDHDIVGNSGSKMCSFGDCDQTCDAAQSMSCNPITMHWRYSNFWHNPTAGVQFSDDANLWDEFGHVVDVARVDANDHVNI